MEPGEPAVKPRRQYDNSNRQHLAAAARAVVVREATRLFLELGFARTTIAAIAAAAGVSPETIYRTFGGKPGVLRAACLAALAGEAPVHAEARSDALQAALTDPREIVRSWGRLVSEVAPRISPLLLLVRDAAGSDPEMARFRLEMEEQRLERMTHNARNLVANGHLAEALPIESAAEVMWTYTSPELFELLVLRRGWDIERFAGFVTDALTAALLSPRGLDRA